MRSPPANSRTTKRKSRQPTRPRRSKQPSDQRVMQTQVPSSRMSSNHSPAGGGRLWFYGRHAVEAALKNPRRTCHQLLATDEALERLSGEARGKAHDIQRVDRADLDKKLGEHTVHQGLALAVAPLPSLSLEKVAGPSAGADSSPAADAETVTSRSDSATILVLDRINDPHNLGAILRSAVAFGVRAVVVPARQSAELGGATAKAASGALDLIPIVEVTNLARSLDALKNMGYWRAGLDGSATQRLDEAPHFEKLALVLGAEGTGIRRLVAEHCDLMLQLPISNHMESLNVSVACGIALYALAGKG